MIRCLGVEVTESGGAGGGEGAGIVIYSAVNSPV